MFLKILCILIFVPLLEGNISFAQDPLKVETAHYKLAFENERVQVVNIHYGPHEKSNMHQHSAGVVVSLTNGHLRFTDQKGAAQEVHAIHGEARWFPARKHKVENLSDVSYDAVFIGMKGDATAISSQGKPPTLDGSTEDRSLERALLPFLLAEGMSRDVQGRQQLRKALGIKPASQSEPIHQNQVASAH